MKKKVEETVRKLKLKFNENSIAVVYCSVSSARKMGNYEKQIKPSSSGFKEISKKLLEPFNSA